MISSQKASFSGRACSVSTRQRAVITHVNRHNRINISKVAASASSKIAPEAVTADAARLSRREMAMLALLPALLANAPFEAKAAGGIQIDSETEGFGKHAAQAGDLLLVHYVGSLADSGVVFDSTRGGLMEAQASTVQSPSSSAQTPSLGLEGMHIGRTCTITVPAELGFGDGSVGAPYAVVPPNATLKYEIQLIRLSNRGPDELTTGIVKCGAGGMSETAEMCTGIEPAEFLL
eukprot:gene8972-16106_t